MPRPHNEEYPENPDKRGSSRLTTGQVWEINELGEDVRAFLSMPERAKFVTTADQMIYFTCYMLDRERPGYGKDDRIISVKEWARRYLNE